MLTAPKPANESARLARLRLLNILDTQPEERFDRLTRMARHLFKTQIATVTLVDADRQWFKSRVGIEATETARDISFCGHAILEDDVMLIPDATLDHRFLDNPLVTGNPNIRFYAGAPLNVAGMNVGTLCIIDDKPRDFSPEDIEVLRDLARMAEQELAAVQLATTDHLTSLSNRRGFEILSRHTLSVCKRLERPATLLYFDLDRFKIINDTLGHAIGDNALKLFAFALLSVFRESDNIGRLGGDEFVVLLTDASVECSTDAVSRLRTWLDNHSTNTHMGFEIQFSAGQVQFDPETHQSIEDLLRAGDTLMYEAKRATRQ